MKKGFILFWIIGLVALASWETSAATSKFMLPPLPYPHNALEPYISEKTLSFHYDKHHQGYVDKLNDLISEQKLQVLSLEGMIIKSRDNPELKSVFNNAAQIWNHTFYWSSLKKGGGGEPTGLIRGLIQNSFGSYEDFKAQFIDAGAKQFGSGWVWLVQTADRSLKIVATANADLPLEPGQKFLLVCDIWEHAYYLDYQDRRKDYVTVFLDHLVNWDFANQNLTKISAFG